MRILLIVAFFLILLPFGLCSSERVDSVIIFTEQMPPYNYFNDQQQIIGINIDITKEILNRANIKYHFELAPWKRAYKKTLKTPHSGIVSTAFTAHREPLFKWVGPIASSKGYLYKLSSRNDIQLTTLSDSKAYTVAAIRGGVYHKAFLELGLIENENLLLFSSSQEYIEPFLKGKIDLILGSDIVIPHLLKSNNIDHSFVVEAIKMPDFSGNYLALHHSFKVQQVEQLNKILDQIKQDGTFDKIINFYMKSPRQRSALSN